MIGASTLVYTARGWKKYDELLVGDTTISYDPTTNTCVYDKIYEIEASYIFKRNLPAIRKLSVNQIMTNDHELMLINQNKIVKRVPIIDRFMKHTRNIVCARPVDYYNLTRDPEEIKWSARIAAIYAQHKYFITDGESRKIIDGLGGYECQIWLDTFFHWNILQPNVNWAKSVLLRNKDVRDMIYDVAPRAGYCVWYGPGKFIHRKGNMWTMRIAKTQDLSPNLKTGWVLREYEGPVFNICTKNGSFVSRTHGGTALISCKEK